MLVGVTYEGHMSSKQPNVEWIKAFVSPMSATSFLKDYIEIRGRDRGGRKEKMLMVLE